MRRGYQIAVLVAVSLFLRALIIGSVFKSSTSADIGTTPATSDAAATADTSPQRIQSSSVSANFQLSSSGRQTIGIGG